MLKSQLSVRVYVGTVLVDDDLQISHSLYHTVKQLVVDRKCVQDTIGKGTIPDFLLKTAVTSLYGKTAQDVVEKSSWDAYKEIMQNKSTAFITKRRKAKCLKLERLFIETK